MPVPAVMSGKSNITDEFGVALIALSEEQDEMISRKRLACALFRYLTLCAIDAQVFCCKRIECHSLVYGVQQ